MPLFGFAINYNSGSTDYAIVAAKDEAEAESLLAVMVGPDGVESVNHYDAEAIISEQYDDCAVLSSEFGG